MKKNVTVLTFQPFSLYEGGGGSRILRRLFQGKEDEILSICFGRQLAKGPGNLIQEVAVPLKPGIKKWHRWYVRKLIQWIRNNLYMQFAVAKLRKIAAATFYDVLHVVDHGPTSAVLCNYPGIKTDNLWVSFHDFYSTSGGKPGNTQMLWNLSKRRFVISKELGQKYQELFGEKDFEIFTDGLYDNEISSPVKVVTNEISVYYSGLMHIDYLPLVKIFAEAMDILQRKGKKVRFILRGTQEVDFLKGRQFQVEYRPFSLDNNELKSELDQATILYLPIKFSVPEFYLYSLSTKMVGYLGGSGAIFYHGPSNSAAARLLEKHNAATISDSMKSEILAEDLLSCVGLAPKLALNAKSLATEQFNLNLMVKKFWN